MKMMPVFEVEEIEKIAKSSFFRSEIAQMVENDSYVSLALDDESLEDLLEEIGYENNASRRMRLQENHRIISAFRKQGYRDEILIRVSW